MNVTGEQILAGLPLSAAITDLNGKITATNPLFDDLLGALLVGKALSDLTPDSSIEQEKAAIEAFRTGRKPKSFTRELLNARGEIFPVEIHVGGIHDDSDSVTHVLITVKPLSEEMKMLKNLQRRNMQLLASSEVARKATQILEINELLTSCVDLIRTHFGFYYAAIFLIDEAGEWVVLQAATGEAGQQLLKNQHKLGVGSQSMVGWVTANSAPRIAQNVGEEAIRFDNPWLPKTQAEMALPLRIRAEVIGVLDVQSTSLNAFVEDDIQTIQMMADQVAIAIDNARLFRERGS